MRSVLELSAALGAIVLLATTSPAQSPPPSQPTALTNVRLQDDVDAPRVSILLRHGRVTEILEAGVELPGGYRRIDGGGGLALPAFVDGASDRGVTAPEIEAERDAMSPLAANVHVGMREANRKGLRPALEVVSALKFEDSDLEAYREHGFAVVHSIASGELLAGQSCVTSLADSALRDRVLANRVFMSAELNASGGGYPSTLMGFLSHLRQFMLDAQWQALRLDRYTKGKLDRRPPYDADLAAIQNVLAGKQRLLCHANSSRDIRRWLKFAKAHGIKIAIEGGREAWKVAPELAEAEIPVFLSLDWGEEVEDPDEEEETEEEGTGEEEGETPSEPESTPEVPGEAPEAVAEGSQEPEETPVLEKQAKVAEQDDPAEAEPGESGEAAQSEEEAQSEETEEAEAKQDWTYEEPVGVKRERRRLWEERRDCALRLQEAGVPIVFATADQSAKDLLGNARTLVELGLSEEVALAAMTSGAAQVLGIGKRVGKLEPGYDANIAIWSDSPFTEKSSLEWLFIDGATFEFEREEEAGGAPAEGVDVTGEWSVAYEDQSGPPATLTLEMTEAGEVTGTLSFKTPDGTTSESEMSGQLSGRDLSLKGSIEMGQFSARIRIEGAVEGDSLRGDATWKFSGGEDSNSFTATRKPNWSEAGHSHGGHSDDGGPH